MIKRGDSGQKKSCRGQRGGGKADPKRRLKSWVLAAGSVEKNGKRELGLAGGTRQRT